MTEGFSCAQKISATFKGFRSIFNPCFSLNSGAEQTIVQKNKDTARLQKLEDDWKILIDKVNSLEKGQSEIVEVKSSDVGDKTLQQLENIGSEISSMSNRIEEIENRMSQLESQKVANLERIEEMERALVKVEQASWLSVDLDSGEEEESLREKN